MYFLPSHQNCRYYSETIPYWPIEPRKKNLWLGITGDKIIDRIFFDKKLTGDGYLQFSQNPLVPELIQTFPKKKKIRQSLNEILFRRGRSGAIEWPSKSPDVTL